MAKDAQPRTPFVRSRLGERLRELREEAGVSVKAIAERLDLRQGTLSKMETGQQSIRLAYVEIMCQEYGASEEETAELKKWAKQTGQANPLQTYSDVANVETLDWAQVEGICDEIWAHGTGQPYGPFQSPDYIRALRKAVQPESTAADLDRSVELRQIRLEKLEGKIVHVTIDEAVLHRMVGGPAVMKGLCRYLQEVAAKPGKTVQIIPLAAGGYVVQDAGFRIAHGVPPEPKADVVHLEHDRVAWYLGSEHLARYKAIFTRMIDPQQGVALTQEESWNLLDRLATNL